MKHRASKLARLALSAALLAAAAADPAVACTRTLYVEIDVDNRDGFLLAGSFTYVRLKVPQPSLPQIPVAALLQRGGAATVALAGEDGVVHLRPVKVASTDGLMISVAEGVKPGERVAVNVPNDVTEGSHIRAVSGR